MPNLLLLLRLDTWLLLNSGVAQQLELTNWDSKINYSTLELNISEVKELTQETPITRTFGQDIAERFRSSCQWLLQAVKNGILFFISAVPVLIIPIVIAIVVLLIIRAKRSSKRRKNDVDSAR